MSDSSASDTSDWQSPHPSPPDYVGPSNLFEFEDLARRLAALDMPPPADPNAAAAEAAAARLNVELDAKRQTLKNQIKGEKNAFTRQVNLMISEYMDKFLAETEAVGPNYVHFSAETHKAYLTKLDELLAELKRRLDVMRNTHSILMSLYDDPTDDQLGQLDRYEKTFHETSDKLVALKRGIERKILHDDGVASLLTPFQIAELREKSATKLQSYDISRQLSPFDGKSLPDYIRWRQSAKKCVQDLDNLQESRGMIVRRLRSTLSGPPLEMISQIPDLPVGLDMLFSVLDSRYLQRHLELKSSLTKFLELPRIADSPSDVQKLFTQAQIFIQTLTLGQCGPPGNPRGLTDREMLDVVFLAAMESKLGPKVLENWLVLLDNRSNPDAAYGATVDHEAGLNFLANETAKLFELDKERKKKEKVDKQKAKKKDREHSNSIPKGFYTKPGYGACIFCSKHHSPLTCTQLPPDMAVATKKLTEAKLCLNCGLPWHHRTHQCASQNKCQHCSQPHLAKFHKPLMELRKKNKAKIKTKRPQQHLVATSVSTSDQQVTVEVPPNPKSLATKTNSQGQDQASSNPRGLLRTCLAYAVGPNGQKVKIRILFDSGSQQTILSEDTALQLGLVGRPRKLVFESLGGKSNFIQSREIEFQLQSLDGSYLSPHIRGATMNHIASGVEGAQFNPKNYPWLADLQWTETLPSQDNLEISCLISEPYYSLLMLPEIRANGNQIQYPAAAKSKLGWLPIGPVCPAQNPVSRPKMFFVTSRPDEDDLNKLFDKFITNESCDGISQKDSEFTILEQQAVDLLTSGMKYDPDNHKWTTPLLFKPEANPARDLSQNKIRAEKIIDSHFKRMTTDQRAQCDQEFQKLIQQGYVSKVPEDEISIPLKEGELTSEYYVEMLPVWSSTSTTTKLRLVFNLSSKSKTGQSLNDILLTGPNYLPNGSTFQIRMRSQEFLISADINKFFLRIDVDPEMRRWQRIRYRFSDENDFATYQANSHLFGANSSPFVAQHIMRTTALMHRERFPLGADAILNQQYMDDLLLLADSEDECLRTFKEAEEITHRAGMTLHKVVASKASMLEKLPKECLNVHTDETSCLGMTWNTEMDILSYPFVPKILQLQDPETRRQSLKQLAMAFDMIGVSLPLITRGKILISLIWTLTKHWDQVIPDENILIMLQEWREDLKQIADLKIDRYLGCSLWADDTLLCIFVDANPEVAGAVCYAVNRNEGKSSFLLAKSRVLKANTKIDGEKTIARNELTALVLGAKIAQYLINQLNVRKGQVHVFTDSALNLARTRNSPQKYQLWVGNRLRKIQDSILTSQIHFVQGDINPADRLTKFGRKNNLSENLWLHGPDFLLEDKSKWPKCQGIEKKADLELKQTKQFMTKQSESNEFYTWFQSVSNFTVLTLIMTRVLMFLNRLQRKTLTWSEMKLQAEWKIFKICQAHWFPDEIQALKRKAKLPRASPLHGKFYYLDNEGLIREKTRFSNHSPVVLSGKDPIVGKMILAIHTAFGHCTHQTTMMEILSRFRIIGGKRAILNWLRKCSHRLCIPIPKNNPQRMADVPKFRLEATYVSYSHCMVDTAGPLKIQAGKNTIKAYVLLIMCLQTRHLSLYGLLDLTIGSFLNQLFLHFCQKGVAVCIYADNALQFKKAASVFQGVNLLTLSDIQSFASKYELEFRFGIPLTPHYQGSVERAVKMTKHHLRRILYNKSISYVDLSEILLFIASIINDRPLVQCQDNEMVLSPNQLIFGRNFLAARIQFRNMTSKPEHFHRNRLQIVHEFWKKFYITYLQSLKPRIKWKTELNPVPRPDDVVFVVEKNLPRSMWKLAKVEQVHFRADGLPARVTLNRGFGKKSIDRHISQIALLESRNE